METRTVERPEPAGYLDVSTLLEELEKDLRSALVQPPKPSGNEAIIAVLSRAADDNKFLAKLADDPSKALAEYSLTLEEKAALACGDLNWIESRVGKLDKRLSTWIWCRLQQEKW